MGTYDLAGNDLKVLSLCVGCTSTGETGTAISSAELGALDGVTPGTATASKAVVLGASKEIATITTATITDLTTTTLATTTGTITDLTAPTLGSTTGTITTLTTTTLTPTTIAGTPAFSGVATFNANPTFGAGFTLNLDSAPVSLTSHAVTASKYAGVVTTEALTTAAGASQAFVITLAGVAAGDLAFVQAVGGTNTRKNYTLETATTTNTLTVTLYCNEPTNAINGTVIFNYWVVKA